MPRGITPGRLPERRVESYDYTPETFVPFLKELVEASKQSFRQVSLAAGLDHGAVRRFVNGGTKPTRDSCIRLAYYFSIHPNDMLAKAGYPPVDYFDLSLADPEELSPEVKLVGRELMKIEDPAVRRRVCDAVLRLIQEMFTQTS